MGRHRGPKFFFPLPGRKSNSKDDKRDNSDTLTPIPSNSSHPSVSDLSPRFGEPSTSTHSNSKAQRVLGTAGPPFRAPPQPPSVPPSPGYMTITVSEPDSDFDERASSRRGRNGSLAPPQRPNLSNRASSNILPADMAEMERRGSNCSSVSRHLNERTSNSTLRSHYDRQSSPLAISQQTSDSAVRDMALRKGKPQIRTYAHDEHQPSPLMHEYPNEERKEQRRGKPARLDLSKLFPKPRGDHKRGHGVPMLSPTKLVNSPTAMSTSSEIFPRPMTREPTPERSPAKLTKSKRNQAPVFQPARSTSPVRLYKRDEYDSAKINVRRPPPGIQHWFEGYDEDSDEMDEKEPAPVHAPRPLNLANSQPAPPRKSSLKPQPTTRVSQYMQESRKGHHLYANMAVAHSQLSVQSQSSLATTRTKESSISKANLQDSSILSFSSSEDEDEEDARVRRKVSVRDSIDMTDLQGDIIIGRAQTMDVRPQHTRQQSTGKLSLMSTSTNTATIEMIYTPEPYTPVIPHRFPRPLSSNRRSSHVRQPSIIPEDDGVRPKTATDQPMSPSAQSFRTTKSEPRSSKSEKLMAVTAEEMALLEALRKKRADMAQQHWVEGYATAVKQEEVRQTTPPEGASSLHRTSGFLSNESPSVSPIRVVETKKKAVRKSIAPTPTPLLVPPRGRSSMSKDISVGMSMLRDSSSCGPRHSRKPSPISIAHQLSPPPEFSPLDPFPSSPTQSASIASLTTTNHPSPLPSPVTPGPRHGEGDVLVKVASSEPSCDDEEEVTPLETGVIDAPTGSIKPDDSNSNQLQRRRTASSGAEASVVLLSKSSYRDLGDLTTVSEASSRAPSVTDTAPSLPKLPKKSHHRQSTLTLSTIGLPKSRHGSIASRQNSINSLRTASPHSVTERKKTASRVSSISSIKRESVTLGSASTRCSVSEDVLAAWGSLGGLRDYEGARQ
jgi:hypothetical protein